MVFLDGMGRTAARDRGPYDGQGYSGARRGRGYRDMSTALRRGRSGETGKGTYRERHGQQGRRSLHKFLDVALLVMRGEFLAASPSLKEDEGAGSLIIGKNGVLEASRVLSAFCLQNRECFLKISFVPCFGDEDWHKPNFGSVVPYREEVGHVFHPWMVRGCGRDDWAVPPDVGQVKR